MPTEHDLDERLAGGRTALLGDIAQPPLAQVGARAAAIRRRRRVRAGGAALAVVAVVATAVVRAEDGDPVPRVAAPPPAVAPVYTGAGITINGLPDPATALDLPGTVTDVEFADPEHGYAVTSCAGEAGCRPAFAVTSDGGRTWAGRALPGGVPDDAAADLVAFDAARVLLSAGHLAYSSADAGRTWREAVAGTRPAPARPGDALRLPRGARGCPGGPVEVWRPGSGGTTGAAPYGALAAQPDLGVCWVAPAATAGAWWVGGVSGGRAAVAVTTDLGRTWRTTLLDAPGSARVAALGRHVYAVVDGAGAPARVLHSADGGATFRAEPGPGPLPAAVAGEPVPLLDGRLLVAGRRGAWQLSADDGGSFEEAGGTLPTVGRFARTPAGFVAYDLFGGGWSAFSTDGATWRKLDLR